MVKNPSCQDPDRSTYMVKFKKFMLFQEPSLGILGLMLISVCIIAGFYKSAGLQRVKLFKFGGHTNSSEVYYGRKRLDFLSENGDRCDVFEGDWLWDEKYPLYQSKSCRFLDEGFRCSENGRPDFLYTKWRWQPKDCNLPRFNRKQMLESLRHKRVVFVGDSIGRNQWESLLCMLTSSVDEDDSIYEVNGNPITKHKGFLVFKFRDYNCTLEYYRSPFLVLQSRPPPHSPSNVKTTLKLDQMDWSSAKWRHADVIVFNTGHWWNNEKTIRGGCYFQEGEGVKMEMEVETAYKKALETIIAWIDREVDKTRTQVYFRTYAPVHFRAGGSCHLETLPNLVSSPVQHWPQFHIFTDVILNHSDDAKKTLTILNTTVMSSSRKDGHPSWYYYLGRKASHRQDCSHWCLPGVPDAWNEILYAFILKHLLRSGNTNSSAVL